MSERLHDVRVLRESEQDSIVGQEMPVRIFCRIMSVCGQYKYSLSGHERKNLLRDDREQKVYGAFATPEHGSLRLAQSSSNEEQCSPQSSEVCVTAVSQYITDPFPLK